MFGVWFTALLLHAIVKGSEICYNRVGCFENGPPWGGTLQRPMLGFPEPPDIVNTAFHLYTRESPVYFQFLLQKEDINCIVVNWKAGAANLYTQAVQNIRIVGAELAYLLEYLERNCGYSPSNVHIIGHSLGAHAGGEAGRRKPGLSRITGA
ncbi:hypothetical protein JD844_006800 [Phrynosoma platyrhinos]|uniref:Triacylglycerol lipase n=1 Tax=Phrynosoma platyrhinos TaxID=52577 RepID=A0ABQ7T2I8_PHRPL|nr:hypothetical protein JD844_006800 [Phrynosoma platyrhinos]